MHIIKNALRCISRSAGQNILIGIIALVIAVSSSDISAFENSLADQGKCVILVSHSAEVADLCDERYELVKVSGNGTKKLSQR